MPKIRLSLTPLSIFEKRQKCANLSDFLLWNLYLECNCSETMRARRMVVRSFFRALLCPITFAVLVRWHLSRQSLTLHCDPLWSCAHLYLHLRSSTYTWAHHCRSPRFNVYFGAAQQNRTKQKCIHKNCCCTKWAKKSGGDKSTVASTEHKPSSCAVPGGKYL